MKPTFGMEERLQRQRFERKYFITERQAIQIRDLVKSYLVPDEFSAGRADFSYPVHSLYLDSQELLTYWATVHCETKRFKLRVRFTTMTRSPRCSSRSNTARTSACANSVAQCGDGRADFCWRDNCRRRNTSSAGSHIIMWPCNSSVILCSGYRRGPWHTSPTCAKRG